MDKIVCVRFFRVSRASTDHPALADLLRRIGDINQIPNREKMLAPNFEVRLEVFDIDGRDAVVGEMTRIQSTNLPSQIHAGRRTPLTDVDRLGHSVVFRYNKKTSVLGIQYDKRVLPPYRFFQYVQSFEAGTKYDYAPVVREDMWERFEAKDPRTLELTVADPRTLAQAAREELPVLDAMAAMGRAYNAPTITVRLSMGHHRGQLGDNITAAARRLLRMRASGAIDLQKLKARCSDEEGADDINLLDEMLEHKEELELHNKDPDVNYAVKLNYVKRCMRNVT